MTFHVILMPGESKPTFMAGVDADDDKFNDIESMLGSEENILSPHSHNNSPQLD